MSVRLVILILLLGFACSATALPGAEYLLHIKPDDYAELRAIVNNFAKKNSLLVQDEGSRWIKEGYVHDDPKSFVLVILYKDEDVSIVFDNELVKRPDGSIEITFTNYRHFQKFDYIVSGLISSLRERWPYSLEFRDKWDK